MQTTPKHPFSELNGARCLVQFVRYENGILARPDSIGDCSPVVANGYRGDGVAWADHFDGAPALIIAARSTRHPMARPYFPASIVIEERTS